MLHHTVRFQRVVFNFVAAVLGGSSSAPAWQRPRAERDVPTDKLYWVWKNDQNVQEDTRAAVHQTQMLGDGGSRSRHGNSGVRWRSGLACRSVTLNSTTVNEPFLYGPFLVHRVTVTLEQKKILHKLGSTNFSTMSLYGTVPILVLTEMTAIVTFLAIKWMSQLYLYVA